MPRHGSNKMQYPKDPDVSRKAGNIKRHGDDKTLTLCCPDCPFRTFSDEKFKEHWREKHARTARTVHRTVR